MENQTKHTPLPWHFTDQLETKGQAIYTVGYTDETGDRTHDIRFLPPVSDWHTAHANALFIEKAVNSHYALVEACRSVVEMLSSPKFVEWQTRFRQSDSEWAMVSAMDMREQECRAAIQKAQSEETVATGDLRDHLG